MPTLFGCSTTMVKPKPEPILPVITMRTDMYPQSITRGEYYEQMANGYAEIKEYDKAVEFYKLALLHNPDSVSGYMGLADVYVTMKKHLLALICLQEAGRLQPDNVKMINKIGDLYLNAGLYTKAREVYQHALSLNHNDEEVQWALLYIYKLEKKYNDALIDLVKIPVTNENAGKISYEKALIFKEKKFIVK